MIKFAINTDTGIGGTFVWPETPETQEDMREALRQYGDWIYGAGGQPVQFEYRNHWIPKLNAAENFTLTIIEKD